MGFSTLVHLTVSNLIHAGIPLLFSILDSFDISLLFTCVRNSTSSVLSAKYKADFEHP